MTAILEPSVGDLFDANLQRIAHLGPATEEGFQAAVEFGKELVGHKRRINFTMGDVALLLAPGPLTGARPDGSLVDRDSKRLAAWSAAIDMDHTRVLGLRRTALAFPPARRDPRVAHRTYAELASAETVEGRSPVEWVESFISTEGRAPKYDDVVAGLGRMDGRAVTAVSRATEKTKVEITETLIATDPAVAEAAEAALAVRAAREDAERQRHLDGGESSTALSVSLEVLEIEQALTRIIPILSRAADNVDLIAGATQAEHIAMLAAQVGRMATHLGEVVSLDPAQVH